MTFLGRKHSEATKRKISESLKGRYPSEATRRKLSEAAKGVKNPNYGRSCSDETRRKISEAAKGRKLSKEHRRRIAAAGRGEKNHNYGKRPSKKTRRKLSEALKGKMVGKKNPNWKGGITSENHRLRTSTEYRQWRKAVFERDGYTCQLCGDSRRGSLNAHHISSWAEYLERRYDVGNGKTLCEKCHRQL